ncbi:hypothetical protein [Syntrophomonas zehnderi]|nr:hypothetical protein [Syntrophomonas zehnderi]
MIKIQIVCQQCGANMELCQRTPQEVYFDNFGYAEENKLEALDVTLYQLQMDIESKEFNCFEYSL